MKLLFTCPRNRLRLFATALFTACLLTVAAAPVLAFAEEAERTPEHEQHSALTWRRIMLADVGENASDEEKAEAHRETVSFWGSVVNFSLLVFLIRWKTKKPLAGFLEARREEIERGMAEATVLKTKAEAVFNEYTERMKTLDQELDKLRSDMAKSAEQDKARIVAEAEEASRRLRTETEAQIVRLAEQLETQIRREVVEAALGAAEKAVREKTTADDQRRLAETFAKDIAAVKTSPSMEKRA